MLQEAGKDAGKQAQVREFLNQAKTRLDAFQKVLDERGKPAETTAPIAPAIPPMPKIADEQTGPLTQTQRDAWDARDKAEMEQAAGIGSNSGAVDRLKNQIDTATKRGLKLLKFTINRGAGEKPVVIGVNAEVDEPEDIIKYLKKANVTTGKVHVESSDPDHHLSWDFYLGEAPPPGAIPKH
jgi:hypothetical protein